MTSYVSAALRREVETRAEGLCEYCLIHEQNTYLGCQVDHVISEKHGGATEASNLAYACACCNPLRNSGDFGSRASHDFSVHQPQALELPGGKILVAHGQDEEVRALVIFDTKWLYEPRRRSTFENDLSDWSTHKYIKGIVGHCAYNRVPGPRLIRHPDKTGAKRLPKWMGLRISYRSWKTPVSRCCGDLCTKSTAGGSGGRTSRTLRIRLLCGV